MALVGKNVRYHRSHFKLVRPNCRILRKVRPDPARLMPRLGRHGGAERVVNLFDKDSYVETAPRGRSLTEIDAIRVIDYTTLP